MSSLRRYLLQAGIGLLGGHVIFVVHGAALGWFYYFLSLLIPALNPPFLLHWYALILSLGASTLLALHADSPSIALRRVAILAAPFLILSIFGFLPFLLFPHWD